VDLIHLLYDRPIARISQAQTTYQVPYIHNKLPYVAKTMEGKGPRTQAIWIMTYKELYFRYHNTSDPYFQHQTQTFQQPLPIKPASSAGSGPSVMLPPLMTPAQQLQSFVQPQQHSQTHNGLPEQWRAIATPRRALSQVPPRRSQSRASQPTPEQSVTRTPVPRAGDYAYVPVSPRFGDLYRPKQCDNMGNPTTWEHTITKEEYTCDELWVIHDGIEVWAYLHTHPDIRRLGMNH